MYCQSCGAENTEDARFCNMCGTSLAKAGETGGLLADPDVASQMAESTVPDSPPTATAGQHNTPGRTIVGGVGSRSGAVSSTGTEPAAYDADLGASGTSMMGVSLADIGVKSSKKTWSMIFLGAFALLGAGALASWLAMGGSSATNGHAEADDPFVIGSPLPSDGDVDSITGMAGVATSASESEMQHTTDSTPSMRSGTMSSDTMNSVSSPATMSTMSTASMTTTMTSMTTTQAVQPASMTRTNTTNTGGSTAQMSAEMSGTTMSGTTTMSTNTSDIEVPEERDIEMELYSARVRFLIQRYYASRAQACFDRATRNNPSVSGTVIIAMTIGAEGNISNTSVARNTTGNSVLGTCLSSQVSSWRLSAPPGGSLSMQIPFSR